MMVFSDDEENESNQCLQYPEDKPLRDSQSGRRRRVENLPGQLSSAVKISVFSKIEIWFFSLNPYHLWFSFWVSFQTDDEKGTFKAKGVGL